MKKYIIGIVLALALPSLVLAFNAATLTDGINRVAVYTKAQADKLFADGYVLEEKAGNECVKCVGASSGTNHSNLEYFNAGQVVGGNLLTITATATQAARTLTVAEIQNNAQIDMAAVNGVALSLTTPTFAAMSSFLPVIGDTKVLYLRNLNTTAASTTTLVAGTAIDLRHSSDTGADVILAGGENATLTLRRSSATAIIVEAEIDMVGD